MTPISLAKGANIPVAATSVRAVLSWADLPDAPDADASALLLTADGKVRGDDDFVFYNQPAHPSGAVRHAGKHAGADAVEIDLAALEPAVTRVVLAASADGGTFGRFRELRMRLLDAGSGAELAVFEMAATSETAFVSGELYLCDGRWKFRAVGQGYDSGLAGLAVDFGISVDDAGGEADPAPDDVPPEAATPAPGTSGQRADVPRGEESLPVDMHKRLSLRKQHVTVNLAKRGAAGTRARVVLVLDASGSMAKLYAARVVHDVVERMAAVAAALDDDGEMQAWTFASKPARLPDLRIAGLPEWLELHIRGSEIALLRRRKKAKEGADRALRAGQVDMSRIGFGNEEHLVIREVREFVTQQPRQEPTLVLFFSDGGVYRNDLIERELRATEPLPVFWQFVGLGNAGFGVLERFDTLPDRTIDNVGFFSVGDIARVPDEELYERLLSEFPTWLAAARRTGVVTS
ncbi:VWA domain-containing protein [Streptomyces sp. NPDC049879]|uniref:VWA domain-containing protein n=1 Tax=Streptomyces sp. NPDC049879 TaxID=3365598 RepID=UPI003793677C